MTDKLKLYTCTIFTGIAEINSNVRIIPGFFHVDFSQKQDAVVTPPIRITFLVNKSANNSLNIAHSFGYFYGDQEGNSVFRKYHFPCNLKAWIELKGVNKNPVIDINKTYYRLGKVGINNFSPPGVHVRDVLIAALIRTGYAPLHGAAFANENHDGILVVGHPGIGKTRVLIDALQHGYQYLSDDLTITDSNGYILMVS